MQIGTTASVQVTVSTATAAAPLGSLSAPLTTGGAITSLAVNPLANAIAAGTITITDPTGSNSQTWTTTGAAAFATSIPVSSQIPNFAYPIGTAISAGALQYVLPAGTQFVLDGFAFVTYIAYTIDSGNAAPVQVFAVAPGTAYNGAGSGGNIQLVSQIDWVTTTTLSPGYSATGGQDPETADSYLSRLTGTMTTFAQRPITANDYSIMALNFSPLSGTDQQEVGRAAAIDGALLSVPVERSVTLYVTDNNGNPLNSDTLAAVAAWFETLREAGFLITVENPSYQPVYVTAQVQAQARLYPGRSTSQCANGASQLAFTCILGDFVPGRDMGNHLGDRIPVPA